MAARPKKFRLRAEQIEQLIPGIGGCIASDRITVDGRPVGSMVREAADRTEDSGWVFLAGDESQAYLDEPSNLAVHDVNTVANYDPAIIPYLYALPGQRFDRDPETNGFVEAPDSYPDESAANLPPGVEVAQGRVAVSEDWSIDLPTPFRRRREDGSIVLWRPGLTFWVDVFRRATGSAEDCLKTVRADVSPNASGLRTSEGGGLLRFSYRLREDTTDARVSSLYVFVIGGRGHVQLGVYADREDDIAAAYTVVESVRREPVTC